MARFAFVGDLEQALLAVPKVCVDDVRESVFRLLSLYILRDDFGGHCLARSGGSGEQRANPAALGKLAPEPPVNNDAVAVHNLVAELSQLLSLVEGKHEVVPMVMWFNLDGQLR